MKEYKVEEVFGLTRGIPLIYTKRESVDNLFVSSLKQNKHIVVFGCSKQGKTSLRNTHLREDECLKIPCNLNVKMDDITKQILKAAGFKPISREVESAEFNVQGKLSGGAKLFSFVETKAEGGLEKKQKTEVEEKPFEIDLNNTNEVIEVIKKSKFSKFILIDEFHCLNEKTQKDLTFALKSYYENSNLIFILIGVWKDKNKITSLNRDLIGRIISIDADKWTDEDLRNLIELGTKFLNIKFNDTLIENILDYSFGSVYFVQEVCYSICNKYNILKTVFSNGASIKKVFDDDGKEYESFDDGRFFIKGEGFDIKPICIELINQSSPHFYEFFMKFRNEKKEVCKYIISLILESDPYSLLEGIQIDIMVNHIAKSDLKSPLNDKPQLIYELKLLNTLQFDLEITPNIIEFDDSLMKINIVDKGLLIWLNLENRG